MFQKNIAKMIEQTQQQIKKVNDEIKKITVTGSAGGGMVTMTMNGAYEVLSIDYDDTVFDDTELLTDLTIAAFNDATYQLKEKTQHLRDGAVPDFLTDMIDKSKMPF